MSGIVVRMSAEQRLTIAHNSGVLERIPAKEKAVYLASIEKRICEYGSNKELCKDLMPVIAGVAKDVGYKAWGNNINEDAYLVTRLADIMEIYYEHFTVKDIKVAFSMLIAGELDGFLPKRSDGTADTGHYQQFTVDYICRILGAYRKYRLEIVSRVREMLPKPSAPRNEEDEKMYHTAIVEDFLGAFKEYQATHRLPDCSPAAEILFLGFLKGYAPVVERESNDEVMQEVAAFYSRRTENKLYEKYSSKRRASIMAGFDALIRQGIEIETLVK